VWSSGNSASALASVRKSRGTLSNLKGAAVAIDTAEAGPYCHMQFSAIEPSSLGTDHPVLESAATGEIIDFYGACNHDPLGKDEVKSQLHDLEFDLGRDG
jgi:hypothetical protein